MRHEQLEVVSGVENVVVVYQALLFGFFGRFSAMLRSGLGTT
jgi:hypothetical protein